MKKLLMLLILTLSLMACSTIEVEEPSPEPINYYEFMQRVEEPTPIETGGLFNKVTYYVSHKVTLNPNEVLYYAPLKVIYEEEIYLNKRSIYFIIANEKNFRELSEEELQIIFKGE